MRYNNGKTIKGIPQEEQHWCEYKNKKVKHTYYIHPIVKTRFGEICTECDSTCNADCEWEKNSL